MEDVFATADSAVNAVFGESVSKDVVYRRGVAEITVPATLEGIEIVETEGVVDRIELTWFSFSEADLVDGGIATPKRADQIDETFSGATITRHVGHAPQETVFKRDGHGGRIWVATLERR